MKSENTSYRYFAAFGALSILVFTAFMWTQFTGAPAKSELYDKNVPGRLDIVSEYLNSFIVKNSRLPTGDELAVWWPDKALFRCAVTGKKFKFLDPGWTDAEFLGPHKVVLIVSSEPHSVKELDQLGTASARNRISLALTMINKEIYWETLDQNQLLDLMLPQAERMIGRDEKL